MLNYLPVCKYRGTASHIKYPCWASIKIDGELNYLIVKAQKTILANKPVHGRIRLDTEVNKQAEVLPDGIYLGELYYNEGKTLQDFYNFLANRSNNKDLKLAIWGVLATPQNSDLTATESYSILENIRSIIAPMTHITVIPFWKIDNRKMLDILCKSVLIQGWEGIVVRNEDSRWRQGNNTNWIKIKDKERRV